MKKIQEFISHEENLEKICNHDMKMVKSLKSTFVNFFKLDSKVITFIKFQTKIK